MAVEGGRGCGFRTVGGLYLMGGQGYQHCDRLKLEIPVCPCCGETLRPNRGIQPVNMMELVGLHDEEACNDPDACRVCIPLDTALTHCKDFIIWVGREYYTEESFNVEAHSMGISRKIPHIPEGLIVGESCIYLAMRGNINTRAGDDRDGRPIKKNGIFSAYVPQRLELLIWESEATDEFLVSLAERNITPAIIPDGDEDHTPRRHSRPIFEFMNIESEQRTIEDFVDGL